MPNGLTESCTVKRVRSGHGISWRKNVSRVHSREKRTVLSIRAFFCPLPGELSCCTLIPHNPSPARYLLARVSQPVELLFGESTEGQKATMPLLPNLPDTHVRHERKIRLSLMAHKGNG